MAISGHIIRLATAGDVDDGKSTLIGRLLVDANRVYVDHYAALERASRKQGSLEVNLALITDGLRAEREQGITIDVAYRYFDYLGSRYILADCPGHAQYTRNMVSGSVCANVLLLLVDANHGMTEQTRRHLTVAILFEVPSILICINKMDLFDYKRERYEEIVREIRCFAEALGRENLHFLPISALRGENLLSPATAMDWYDGPYLMQLVEALSAVVKRRPSVRLLVQMPRFTQINGHRERVQLAYLQSGTVKVGQTLRAIYGGQDVTLQKIWLSTVSVPFAQMGSTLVCQMDSEVDLGRGEVLLAVGEAVVLSNRWKSRIVWFSEKPMDVQADFDLQFGVRRITARVESVLGRLDLNSGREVSTDQAPRLNEVFGLSWLSPEPLFNEPVAGEWLRKFIVVDRQSGNTVAVGILT